MVENNNVLQEVYSILSSPPVPLSSLMERREVVIPPLPSVSIDKVRGIQGIPYNDFEQKIFSDSMQRDTQDKYDNIKKYKYENNGIINLPTGNRFELTREGYSQLLTRLNIPEYFFNKLPTDLQYVIANQLIQQPINENIDFDKEVLFRIQSNNEVRAILSERYGVLDNLDVIEQLHKIPELKLDNAIVTDSSICNKRLSFDLVYPESITECRKGDKVATGFRISNSEIGYGYYSVSSFILQLSCLNGMSKHVAEDSYRTKHVGNIASRAFSRLQGMVQDSLEGNMELIAKFKNSLNDRISDLKTTVENLVMKNKLPKRDTENIIEKTLYEKTLDSMNPLSTYHLVSGITRYANTVSSYEGKTNLQRIAVKQLI